MKVKTVKEIKKLIDKVILPGYTYKTNFSSAEFLVYFSFGVNLVAKLVRYADKVEYEFVLDTQFLFSKEITKAEINMVSQVLDILEDNKKFVLSRLKKYTVKEYDEEMKRKKEQSEAMFEALKDMFKTLYLNE